MRLLRGALGASLILLATSACGVDSIVPTPVTGIVGNWTLQSVGGRPLPVQWDSNTELRGGTLQLDVEGNVLELENWRDTRPGGAVTTIPLQAHWTASGAGYTFSYNDGRVLEVDLNGSTLTLHTTTSPSGDQVYHPA
jgi:hypothetical protein